MSTPQVKLKWDDLTATDEAGLKATVDVNKQMLEEKAATANALTEKALRSGYGLKLNWDELTPVDAPARTTKIIGKAKAVQSTTQFDPADQAAAQFEVLKRAGRLDATGPLTDKLKAAGWEVGDDYVKPPAGAATPLWDYQIGGRGATVTAKGEVAPIDARAAIGKYAMEILEPAAKMIGKTAAASARMIGAGGLIGGNAISGAKELIEPQVEQYKRAMELANQRGYKDGRAAMGDPEIAAHFTAALLPMFGPVAATAGEQLGHKDIRGFTQSVIMLAAPEIFKMVKGGMPIRKAVATVASDLPRLLGPAPREVLESASVGPFEAPEAGAAKQIARTRPTGPQDITYPNRPMTKTEIHHSNFQPRTPEGTFAEGTPIEYHQAKAAPVEAPETPAIPSPETPPIQQAAQGVESVPSASAPQVAGETTGIANAVTEAERAARGLDPIETAMTREWSGPVVAEGRALVDSDPAYRAKVSGLVDNPRPLTDAENAALTYDRMRLRNEHKAVTAQIEQAVDAGDVTTANRLKDQQASIENAIGENDLAAKATGTEAGRGFNARKMMIAEDYSLASLLQKAKVAGSKTVPETVRTQLADLAKRIEDLQAKIDKAETAPPKVAATRTTAQGVVVKLEQAADAARARLQARSTARAEGSLREYGSGGLSTEELTDYATIGAAHLARIGADFATWSAEMVREVGDAIKPYLQQVYAASEAQVRGVQAGRLSTYKKGLLKRTAAAGTPRPETTPLLLDSEAVKLKAQLADAQKSARDVIDRQAPHYWLRRAAREGVSVVNLPRALKASLDISAPGRQGMWFGATHPVVAGRAFAEQLKALRMSKADFEAFNAQMAADPAFLQAQRIGHVEFVGIGDKLGMHEEPYMSELAQKIPGIRHSEQAYNAYLNSVRLQMWKMYAEQLQNPGLQARAFGIKPITPREVPQVYKALGSFINEGTGRGSLGRANSIAPWLNSGFFAPRWVASRMRLLTPLGVPYYISLPGPVRLIAMREAIKFTGVIGATLYLAKQAGAETSLDPNSADFLKLKVGNVHYDISGGFQQEIKFIARMLQAANRTASGKAIKGKGPMNDKTMGDIAGDYLRNKLSPPAGVAADIFVTGEMKKWGKETPERASEKPLKPTLGREMKELFIPMVANDFIEAAQVEGKKGLLKAAPSVVGIGVNTYLGPTGIQQQKKAAREQQREHIRGLQKGAH